MSSRILFNFLPAHRAAMVGYKIRRIGWDHWLRFYNGLWWVIPASGVPRVVTTADMTSSDLQAADWTHMSDQCLSAVQKDEPNRFPTCPLPFNPDPLPPEDPVTPNDPDVPADPPPENLPVKGPFFYPNIDLFEWRFPGTGQGYIAQPPAPNGPAGPSSPAFPPPAPVVVPVLSLEARIVEQCVTDPTYSGVGTCTVRGSITVTSVPPVAIAGFHPFSVNLYIWGRVDQYQISPFYPVGGAELQVMVIPGQTVQFERTVSNFIIGGSPLMVKAACQYGPAGALAESATIQLAVPDLCSFGFALDRYRDGTVARLGDGNLSTTNYIEPIGSCGVTSGLQILNPFNRYVTLTISGTVDDDVLFNGAVYEEGLYPFFGVQTALRCTGVNGAHSFRTEYGLGPGATLTIKGRDNGLGGGIRAAITATLPRIPL